MNLFTKCRNGQVAVIMGSTEKMGTGTNIQDRAIALHHLDSSLRHRRFLRRIHVADGHQEGEALSYAEITAIAAGDMRILEKVQLDADIQKIVHQERAFNREHTAVTNRIGDLNGTISRLDEDISTARSQILDGFVATTGDTFTCEVRDMKRLVATLPRIHTDRDDAGLAVQSLVTGQVRYALDRIYEYHQDHPMPLSQVEVRMGSVSFDASVRFNPKNPRNPDVRLAVSVLPSLAVEIPLTEFQTMAERVWDKAPHLAELRGRRDALVAEMLAVEPEPVDAAQGGDIGEGARPDHGSLGVVYGDPFAPMFIPPPAVGGAAGGMRYAP